MRQKCHFIIKGKQVALLPAYFFSFFHDCFNFFHIKLHTYISHNYLSLPQNIVSLTIKNQGMKMRANY